LNVRISPLILTVMILLIGCVDPANIDIPAFQYQLVVDGYITTDPGPYEVKLYRSRPLESADLDRLIPERFAKVWIIDDQGNSEQLTEVEEGVYHTSVNGIEGITGRKYHVEIATISGKKYESTPEEIRPVGEVMAINYDFVAGNGDEFREGDGFRIFADAKGVPNLDDLIRLRMVATYKIETFPNRRTKVIPGSEGEGIRVPDPYPCSGYVNQDNQLVKVSECTCCVCWVNEYDKKPSVADEKFIANDVFLNEELGFIPATNMTLYEKIHVEIQELSLTPETFLFWKLVKAQIDGVSSIFQPPSADIKGNISALNSSEEVLGIFWAAGIHKKSIYIDQSAVPYIVEPIDTLVAPCQFIPYSSNQKPSFWQ
jgi:Domain of unknown function (DUF4249)